MHLIDLRSDVLWCFTPFYLYTLTIVVLNCLLVLLVLNSSDPKEKEIMHLVSTIKFFCVCKNKSETRMTASVLK